MPNDKPIVVAGAGPAGSTLAIRLRRIGLPVTLVERYKFPRAKLCGEFISPECLAHFDELGVLDEMLNAGGDHIFETVFYETGGRSVTVPSRWFDGEGFALSLSRARMDEILLNAARQSGVDVREETSVVGLVNSRTAITGVRLRNKNGEIDEVDSSIVVDATGRARVLARLSDKQSSTNPPKPRFIGLKGHLIGADVPDGVCEIYAFRGGYAGLSRVEGGEANLCLIARSSLMKNAGDADQVFEILKNQNRRASQTLADARKTHDWLAVSVPSIGLNEPPLTRGLFTVGDSAAFVDPFTGSGMLMAMQSSRLLKDSISAVGLDPVVLKQAYYPAFQKQFAPRLGAASVIRRVAYEPRLSALAVRALSMSKKLRAALARKTHSTIQPISR
jgi:menaquinone-9 beta-reductase